MAPAGTGRSVEGIHAVHAALRSGRATRLYVERARAGAAAVVPILEAAVRSGVEIEYVDDARSMAETTAPQGVVAETDPLPERSLAEVVASSTPCALLVLDRVQDARNVGAMARSALAAGFDGLVIAERRAAPLGAAAFKAAAGALETIAVVTVGSVANAVRDLKDLAVWTVGLDAAGETSLFGLDLLAGPVAIVIGSEGTGLSRLVRERVDLLASIPMSGHVESLNASAAATLAVFEVRRARSR